MLLVLQQHQHSLSGKHSAHIWYLFKCYLNQHGLFLFRCCHYFSMIPCPSPLSLLSFPPLSLSISLLSLSLLPSLCDISVSYDITSLPETIINIAKIFLLNLVITLHGFSIFCNFHCNLPKLC